MNKNIIVLVITLAIGLLTGCVSPEVQARRKAEVEADQAEKEVLQKQAAQRIQNAKTNWGKLKQGLTIDEADKLVGPFHKSFKNWVSGDAAISTALGGAGLSSSANATYEAEIYVLQFQNGKLVEWRLTQ